MHQGEFIPNYLCQSGAVMPEMLSHKDNPVQWMEESYDKFVT